MHCGGWIHELNASVWVHIDWHHVTIPKLLHETFVEIYPKIAENAELLLYLYWVQVRTNHEIRGAGVSGYMIIVPVAVRLTGAAQRDEEISRRFVGGRVVKNVEVIDVYVIRQIHDLFATKTTR